MGVREFVLKRDLFRLRPLPVNKLEKIETDRDALDSDQITDMLDMVDVTIERRFFLVRADQDRVDADYAAARANRLNLFVSNVPLDVVKFSRVRVRNDHRPGRDF